MRKGSLSAGTGLVKKAPITVLGRTFEITPVSMGNPHGVIFIDEPVEQFELDKYGPALEHHPAFPEKVNIEFVNVLSPTRLRMRVWERGSGITLACGTGSCAVLAAAKPVRSGGQAGGDRVGWRRASGRMERKNGSCPDDRSGCLCVQWGIRRITRKARKAHDVGDGSGYFRRAGA